MKYFLLLLTTFLFISCENFFQRFDPLEAGYNILTLEELVFYAIDNTVLSMVSKGAINQDEMTIDITLPPSLDLSAQTLIAQCLIKESGFKGGTEHQVQIDRYWEQNEKLTIDRKDFDPQWNGDSTFVNEYTVNIEREFVSKLTVESDGYTNDPNITVKIYFNDIADPDINSPFDFRNGFQFDGDIVPISVGSFSSPSFTGDSSDDSTSYELTLTANSEGIHKISLLDGSIASGSVDIQNTESNTVSITYDVTPPSVPVSNVTASDLDLLVSTDDYNDAVLSLEFEEATDNLTSGTELLYSFYFSDPDDAGDVTGTAATVSSTGYELFYQGNKYAAYQSIFTWDFNDMPQELKDRLSNGTTLFFNVIVKDLASNASLYSEGNVYYKGPSYP